MQTSIPHIQQISMNNWCIIFIYPKWGSIKCTKYLAQNLLSLLSTHIFVMVCAYIYHQIKSFFPYQVFSAHRVQGSQIEQFLLQFDYYNMNRKGINRSTERVLQQKNLNPRISCERKCQTPSIANQQKKSKSKTKQQSADKKMPYYPKHLKNSDTLISHPHATIKKQSPFRHKNRPISNLNNIRHAKNIEHQLSNLNESVNYDSILEDSGKKGRGDSTTNKVITEGKKLMKNNQFQKGLAIFSECTSRDPKNLEAMYLMGVCAFHLEHYQEAITNFTNLLAQDNQYRKNAYLFLAISHKKCNSFEEALLVLTNALHFFPKYFDALILRAKILSKLHRYYDALEDLNKSLKIEPGNSQSLIAKADCFRSLNQFADAVKIYSQILEISWDSEVALKRAIGHIENGSPQQALTDLNRLIHRNPGNSQAYLFKGLAYSKMKNYNQAILAFQQAIKFNSSKKATTKALYEVSKLKIQLGDYYGASYTLQRANTLEVDVKVIEKLKVFTDGATSIMKKKYKRGIQNLNYLSKKQHLSEQIRPLLYSFRSYAYFCQCKFLNALSDLNALQKLGFNLDSASQYNFYLLQGISLAQNNNFSQAIASFNTAQQARRQFSDPIIYKCLTKIGEYNRNPKTKDKNLLQQSLKHIGRALQKQEHYNSHYLCSAILYTLGNFEESLDQIEKAIEKSDEHVIKHFYLRGLINGILGKTKEAFVDFSNVLSLGKQLKQKSQSQQGDKEKEILEAYLNRAKCHLLFGQKKKAFQDLQTYISYKPLDSEIHTVAGRLLFSIGACDDAIKAYNYSPNIDKKKQELLERAKCYLVLKQLNLCLKDLEKTIELGDTHSRYDYCCLSALKQASKGTQQNFKQAMRKISPAQSFNIQRGYIFQQSDLYFYKGVFSFYLGQYPQALKLFLKSKNLKTINKQLEYLEQSDPDKFSSDLFENKIYTDVQIDYNIGICELFTNNKENAKKILSKYQSFELLFGEFPSKDPLDLTPFPFTNRLCSIFPEVEYNENKNVRLRLSFCLPKVYPPEIKFDVEPKIIEQIGMSSAQPRPDAPWIKRNNFGVIFTDEMVGVDIDIKTQKSIKRLEEIKIEADEHLDSPPPAPKEKLKNIFALDADVENKLAKLMKKNQK